VRIELAFLLELGWFVSAVCLVGGLRQLSSPRVTRRGGHLITFGVLLAVAVTFAHPAIGSNLWLILAAMLVGGVTVLVPVRRTAAADSSRLIALFNAIGGAAAALIAAVHLLAIPATRSQRDALRTFDHAFEGIAVPLPGPGENIASVIALLCGSIAAGGSAVAWWRMSSGSAVVRRFEKRQTVYVANAAVVLLLGLVLAVSTTAHAGLLAIFAVACLSFGVGMSLPIARADMPVLIALYNAFAGAAVLLDGLVIDNPTLIIAGSLVFAAASLLMRLTARSMNRRLGDVMYSGLGLSIETTPERRSGDRANPIDAAEASIALGYATRVLVVPGYGMAVSRSHRKLRELVLLLEERGVEVNFVLHPVAGRLPGHMNVLLAEAGVPYDRIVEASEANADMENVDVALVVGADDIVNPAARGGDGGDLTGLAIIEVDRAQRVIVLRRGDGLGHAGIVNPLMGAANVRLMAGDALASVQALIGQVKQLD